MAALVECAPRDNAHALTPNPFFDFHQHCSLFQLLAFNFSPTILLTLFRTFSPNTLNDEKNRNEHGNMHGIALI